VARYLLAGADVVMTTSEHLRHGPGYPTELLDGLSTWMARKGCGTVDELRGMLSASPAADSAARPRSGYVAATRPANVGPNAPW
jgi:dihydroorotate dehydrogenase (fumarate)